MPYVIRLAPEGWLKKQEEQYAIKEDDVDVERQDVKGRAKRSAWARLINKVYGINPLIFERCGSEMRIVAFIMDPEQIDRIMQHLKKQGWSQAKLAARPSSQGRAPPGIAQSSAI